MNTVKVGYQQTEVGVIPKDWEIVSLDFIANVNPRSNLLPDSFVYIDLESVNKGSLLHENHILKEGAPSRAQRLLKKNDILFQMVRPYQKNNLFFDLSGDYVASTGYAQIRSKQNNKFLYYSVHSQRFVYDVMRRSTGTNYPAINSSDLKSLKIPLPSKLEQQKIADILTTWDSAIEKQSALITQKQQLKKGLMQKIFSQEIRFKADDGSSFPDWADKKLGEITKITTGSSNREDSGLNGQYTFFDRSEDIRKSDRYLFDGKAVIVAGEGSSFPPKYFEGKFDLHQRTYAIMNFIKTDSKYIFYFMDEYKNYLSRYAVGSTVKSLRLPMFQKMPVSLPSLPEQTKIANLLTLDDDDLSKLKQALDVLKAQKKGLMQKLLTGQVRVTIN